MYAFGKDGCEVAQSYAALRQRDSFSDSSSGTRIGIRSRGEGKRQVTAANVVNTLTSR